MTSNVITPELLVVFQRELLMKTGNQYISGASMPPNVTAYLGIGDKEVITLYYVCDETMIVTFILCRGPENTNPAEPDARRQQFAESTAYADGYRLRVLLMGNYMCHQ